MQVVLYLKMKHNKQINLFSQSWNTIWKILRVLLIVVLWLRGCSSDSKSPQVAKVTVPEVKGNLRAKKACS
jgi:hypothetical protein